VERLVVERLAPERAVDFFAAPRVERDAGFFAADFEAEEREVERLVDFFAADFFAAPRDAVRPVDFFAAPRDAVRPVDFFAAPRVERDADFRAVDLPPRPADFALDLAVAFLVPEDFEDLPDLPLDAFLPAAAMSRSFL
jgi:hypothetical protein